MLRPHQLGVLVSSKRAWAPETEEAWAGSVPQKRLKLQRPVQTPFVVVATLLFLCLDFFNVILTYILSTNGITRVLLCALLFITVSLSPRGLCRSLGAALVDSITAVWLVQFLLGVSRCFCSGSFCL